MTTEQALREALAELGGAVLALLAAEHGSGMLGPRMTAALMQGEASAGAALALPPSEAREEWRVRYRESRNHDHVGVANSLQEATEYAMVVRSSCPFHRRVRIESRTVSTSPWTVFDPAKAEEPKTL